MREYQDLLEVLKAKISRQSPYNVLWEGCAGAIEGLLEENRQLRAQVERLKGEETEPCG